MSIIQYETPVAHSPVVVDLHREVVVRLAQQALAQAEALRSSDGPFLQSPEAGAVFGRLTQSVDALLWQLTGGAR